ncbi:MAG: class I SAM-dependent methyltransferase, partial [Candidatus Binataceae bacterium]
RLNFEVVGLDSELGMLDKAAKRRLEVASEVREKLVLVQADMRMWRAEPKFDLIAIPCSSITHVLNLQEQIALWELCRRNLNPGGRFLVEVTMPNMAVFADSFSTPPRTLVEIDVDKWNESDGVRFIRRKTSCYLSHEQCVQTRFLYEKYKDGRAIDGSIDDFVGHVFFPRELQLLFIHTGFEVEQTLGDYHGGPLKADSPLIIMIGRLAEQSQTGHSRGE